MTITIIVTIIMRHGTKAKMVLKEPGGRGPRPRLRKQQVLEPSSWLGSGILETLECGRIPNMLLSTFLLITGYWSLWHADVEFGIVV